MNIIFILHIILLFSRDAGARRASLGAPGYSWVITILAGSTELLTGKEAVICQRYFKHTLVDQNNSFCKNQSLLVRLFRRTASLESQ